MKRSAIARRTALVTRTAINRDRVSRPASIANARSSRLLMRRRVNGRYAVGCPRTGTKSCCGPVAVRRPTRRIASGFAEIHHSYFHAHPQEMHELGLMPHAWDVPKC